MGHGRLARVWVGDTWRQQHFCLGAAPAATHRKHLAIYHAEPAPCLDWFACKYSTLPHNVSKYLQITVTKTQLVTPTIRARALSPTSCNWIPIVVLFVLLVPLVLQVLLGILVVPRVVGLVLVLVRVVVLLVRLVVPVVVVVLILFVSLKLLI